MSVWAIRSKYKGILCFTRCGFLCKEFPFAQEDFNGSENIFPKAIEDDEFEDVGNTCNNHTPQDAHDVIDQGKYKGVDVRVALAKKEKGLKERKW